MFFFSFLVLRFNIFRQFRFMQLYVLKACQVVRICVLSVLPYLSCFQGFGAETHVCIILPVHTGLIMRTQACSCIRMNLPKTLNFILLFLVLMQVRGSLRWSHEWSSDPLSSCLMTACFHYMLLPCDANGCTFIGSTN